MHTGKVEILLDEPDWKGDRTGILPGDVLPKNPAITAAENHVTPGFVYIQVLVPYAKCTLANPDKTLYDRDSEGNRAQNNHLLVTFGEGEPVHGSDGSFTCGETLTREEAIYNLDAASGLQTNLNDSVEGWTFLNVQDISMDEVPEEYRIETGEFRYLIYTFAYNSLLANTEKMSEEYKGYSTIKDSTVPIFTKIRVADYIEGQFTDDDLKVPIRAFCIQAAHTSEESRMEDNNGIPETTEEVIREAASAFRTYANQNQDLAYASVLGSAD